MKNVLIVTNKGAEEYKNVKTLLTDFEDYVPDIENRILESKRSEQPADIFDFIYVLENLSNDSLTRMMSKGKRISSDIKNYKDYIIPIDKLRDDIEDENLFKSMLEEFTSQGWVEEKEMDLYETLKVNLYNNEGDIINAIKETIDKDYNNNVKSFKEDLESNEFSEKIKPPKFLEGTRDILYQLVITGDLERLYQLRVELENDFHN